jgi:hypothetical protein
MSDSRIIGDDKGYILSEISGFDEHPDKLIRDDRSRSPSASFGLGTNN